MNGQLKYYFDYPCGLRYVCDALPLASGVSFRFLSESEMMMDAEEIAAYYDSLGEYLSVLRNYPMEVESIRIRLCNIRDVRNSIARLASGAVLDDVELFEMKFLALQAGDVSALCAKTGTDAVHALPDVLELLDPEHNKVPSFYVYDCYSEELAGLRRKMKDSTDDNERQELYQESLTLENEIRKDLCIRLSPCAPGLKDAFDSLVRLDIRLAKAEQIDRMNLVFPAISTDGRTAYRGMFHPQIAEALEKSGSAFQPVDFDFGRDNSAVIGANMGGKTVVLKMLALNQLLFQFGFGIPAEAATIAVKEDVLLSIGDEQNELKGFSSFAAEMKNVDAMIRRADLHQELLCLVDEPARTTNPVEGSALVEGLLRRLEGSGVSLVLTTHYNIRALNCSKFRVQGLENGKMNYSLTRTVSGEVPHEALNIALSLDIDSRWIGYASELLRTTNKTN